MNCGICSQPARDPVVVQTTPEEQQMLRSMGQDATEYHYCGACWALMKDPDHAVSLMAGRLEVGLRQAGVPQSREFSARFREFLLRLRGS